MNSKLVREARKTATLIARVRVPGPTCSTGTSQGAHGTYGRGWQGQPEAPEAQEAPVHRSGPKRKEIRPVLQKKNFAKLILPAWVVVIPNAAKAKAKHIHHPVAFFARTGGGHPKCCKSQGKPYTPPSAHFPFFLRLKSSETQNRRKIVPFCHNS